MRFGLKLDRKDILPLLTPSVALFLSLALLGSTADLGPPGPRWTAPQLAQLRDWARAAPLDGLPQPDLAALDAAERSGRKAQINPAATALALGLAKAHLLGTATAAERIEWHIVDPDAARALEPLLMAALAEDRIDGLFEGLRPLHPAYAALRQALVSERDPVRRDRIARNLERWRWLPQDLGQDFILANAAGFDVALWRGGQEQQRWVTITGRAETPTPSLMAAATGVNFNPWWEVPQSISSTSRMSPQLGYVKVGKRFRQKPGPGNSLGQMKVVMYNPHNIYLHDTPSRSLFGARERAFSHGCIRVNDALGFASTVLGRNLTKDRLDQIIEDKQTVTVPLPRQIPVYVTYFTVDTDRRGQVRFHKDIYGRDQQILAYATPRDAQLALR